MAKKLCRQGEHRVPAERVEKIPRHGGGSYRQAGHMIPTNICDECVLDLTPRADRELRRGASLISRWDAFSIVRAARRLGWSGPTAHRFEVRRAAAEHPAVSVAHALAMREAQE